MFKRSNTFLLIAAAMLVLGAYYSYSHSTNIDAAYAAHLAQVAPLMSLNGTDPEVLKRKSTELAQIMQQLSAAQKTPEEKERVLHLYPTSYLAALAEVEEARTALIASPSKAAAQKYFDTLHTAVKAGEKNIEDFSKDYTVASNNNNNRPIASIGGTLTAEHMKAAIIAIQQGLQTVSANIDAQEKCVQGNKALCPSTPQTYLPFAITDTKASSFPYADSIQALFAQATDSSAEPQMRVVIASSTCRALTPGPYMYVFSLSSTTANSVYMRSLSDIFFTPTKDANGPTISYLKNSLGIQYSVFNPNIFYQCPDSGEDTSKVLTVEQVAAFATTHPALAVKERAQLLSYGSTLYEQDSKQYVVEALRETAAGSMEQRMLISLYQQFTNNSAGLDRVLAQIQIVDQHDLALTQKGVPFDISADTFFLSHSAFPTLYQLYNPTFGATGALTKETGIGSAQKILAGFVRYSALKNTVSESVFIHDLKAFISFEN